MKISYLLQNQVIVRPKLYDFKIFLSKYWFYLLLLCFGFVCLVFLIASNTRSPDKSPKDKFKSLVDCLTSAGVDGKNIIQRSNGTRYTEINWQWNTVNGYVRPMAYLLANDVSDVQNAVICCRLSKVRLVARSGGHSIVKYGFGDSNSLVIDLKRLNKIKIDATKMNCEIGAGARGALVTYTLWKAGEFMIPVGVCPTVGIGGYALGGGYGYYTRFFGLASDNLLELEMVDAKGKLLLINNSTNEDLFWALRGGGGGSFGIVTKLKFKMHSAPKYVLYGIYQYKFDDFQQYYEAWQTFITSGQPYNIGTLTSTHSDSIEMEIFKFYFKSNEKVFADFDDLLDSFSFPKATISSFKKMSYHDFVLMTTQYYSLAPLTELSELANITKHSNVGRTKVKSIYVDNILDKNKISKLQLLLRDYLKVASLHIELNIGAINNFNCSETAFVHRGKNLYHIQLEVFNDKKEQTFLNAVSAMNSFYEASKEILSHGESYQNYMDEDIPDYLERYYGTNLKKLIQVKMRIDPENVFYHPQSIPANFD